MALNVLIETKCHHHQHSSQLNFACVNFAHTKRPSRKIKVTLCNHQADSALMCGLASDLVICKFRKCLAIHDIECPY